MIASISEDDKSFWNESVKDVVRQKKDKAASPRSDAIIKQPQVVVRKRPQYAIKQDFSTYSKALNVGANVGIDKATLKKFKREDFTIEARLDLHGLTEDEAFAKVENFVVQSYNQGKRCIIIITGKGLPHEGDDIFTVHGVLKRQVPQWLDMARMRAMILLYKHPSERLGGGGALYILLRRNKMLQD